MSNDQSAISYKKLSELRLDMLNPRLPNGVNRTEKDVISYIAKTTSIEDLMSAIAANGFFPGEPLVVIEENGAYVVVEGNRRLTAVKLLNNPHIIDNPGRLLLEISQNAIHIPDELPVVVRPSREDVLPYLGFRHITGVKQWEPLAKARYMKQLLDATDAHNSPSERYQEVARMIGSRKDHIKRSLDALAVYDEVESKDFYNIEGLNEESIKFAVLSTALADDRIGTYIGVSSKQDGDEDSSSNDPIVNKGVLKQPEVKELTEWLYKKVGDSTRVGESRNLRQLASVVETPKALIAFKEGSTLEYAYRLSRGADEEFMTLLYEAESTIARAAGLVANAVYSEEAYSVARNLSNNIKMIGNNLKEKRVQDDDF
jgi:hypothetical protein